MTKAKDITRKKSIIKLHFMKMLYFLQSMDKLKSHISDESIKEEIDETVETVIDMESRVSALMGVTKKDLVEAEKSFDKDFQETKEEIINLSKMPN